MVGTVQRNDPGRLEELLEDRARYGHDDMAYALAVAADRGLDDCARILLEAKALPDIHDASGFTPLIKASKEGHDGVVEVSVNLKLHRI